MGLPFWQPDRKPTEIWVVVDNGLRREVMPVELAYVRDALDETAFQRGFPLNWPQPDEEGMYPVDMQLLWGGYTEDLASLAGSTRPTANRTLQPLVTDGVIELGRGRIEVLDRTRLPAPAG